MSSQTETVRRVTVPQIARRKGGEPIVSLTSYHAHTAAIVDRYADFILVGDSLGMVMHGMESTVGVPLDLMIMHGKAVVRGTQKALIVVDMPFGTYEESPQVAFRNAAKIMKETGCQAIKIESGTYAAGQIAHLVERGVPVMGHIGLRPQAVNVDGGFRAKGRTNAERDRVIAEARAADEAGAFAIVIEGVVEPIAIAATKAVAVPTIGIGASAQCDGQVLVTEDMLGMFERVPRFVKKYGNIAETIEQTAAKYAAEVRERSFPTDEQTYQPK